jgi:hypothetical protein
MGIKYRFLKKTTPNIENKIEIKDSFRKRI